MFFRPEDLEKLQEKSQTPDVISSESAAAYAPGTQALAASDTNPQPSSEHLPTVSFFDSTYSNPTGDNANSYFAAAAFNDTAGLTTLETPLPADSGSNQPPSTSGDQSPVSDFISELKIASLDPSNHDVIDWMMGHSPEESPNAPVDERVLEQPDLKVFATNIQQAIDSGAISDSGHYLRDAAANTINDPSVFDVFEKSTIVAPDEEPPADGPGVFDVFEKSPMVTPDEAYDFSTPTDVTPNFDTPGSNYSDGFSQESLYTPTSFLPDSNFPSIDNSSTDNWSLNYSFDTSSMDIGSPNFASGGGQWDEYWTASFGAYSGS